MKNKMLKLVAFTTISLSAVFFAVQGVKADVKNVKLSIADVAVSASAVEATSPDAINATSPAVTTTPPAVTTPEAVEPGEDDKVEIEVLDEFTVGGVFYIVTEIKDDKIYVGVSGVVNDKATTVYIPKKVKYEGREMIVSSIEEDSFSYMTRLRKIVINADIKSIGNGAFKEAVKFNKLVIKTSVLKKVGNNVLKKVSNKLIIEVPKKSVGSYKKLFNNKGIKTVKIKAVKK